MGNIWYIHTSFYYSVILHFHNSYGCCRLFAAEYSMIIKAPTFSMFYNLRVVKSLITQHVLSLDQFIYTTTLCNYLDH